MPPTDDLRTALESCSYKQEIILLTATLSVLDNALQLYNSFMKLGLAHQILLTSDEQVERLTWGTTTGRGACLPRGDSFAHLNAGMSDLVQLPAVTARRPLALNLTFRTNPFPPTALSQFSLLPLLPVPDLPER